MTAQSLARGTEHCEHTVSMSGVSARWEHTNTYLSRSHSAVLNYRNRAAISRALAAVGGHHVSLPARSR